MQVPIGSALWAVTHSLFWMLSLYHWYLGLRLSHRLAEQQKKTDKDCCYNRTFDKMFEKSKTVTASYLSTGKYLIILDSSWNIWLHFAMLLKIFRIALKSHYWCQDDNVIKYAECLWRLEAAICSPHLRSLEKGRNRSSKHCTYYMKQCGTSLS